MSSEPLSIPLVNQETASHDAGVTERQMVIEGIRWAIVEYRAGATRSGWCSTPHSGFVVSGSIRYDFEDDREPLIAGAGHAFLLSAQPGHRGSNATSGTTRLFLIDALPGANEEQANLVP